MQEMDEHIKRMLTDAEEEVPSRVWDAVSARLDQAAAGKKVVPLWRRIVSVGVPAAAAVLLGVFLAHPGSRPSSAPSFDRVIAQAVPAVHEPALVEARPIVLRDRVPSEVAPAAVALDAAPSEPSTAPASASDDAAPAPTGSQTSRKTDSSSDEAAFNALRFAERQQSRDGRLSFSAGGNLQTNGSPAAGGSRFMRSSAQPQTGIVEGTNRYYGIPFSVGIGLQYRFAPRWSVATGLVYSNLSRTFTGRYVELDGTRELKSLQGDIDNVQHYLGIPLNVRYHFIDSPFVRSYAFVGGTVERCLSDKYQIHAADDFFWSKPAQGVQLSAALGFGLELTLTDHLALYADPSLRYWFNCGQPKSIRTQQPLMVGLEVGVRLGW